MIDPRTITVSVYKSRVTRQWRWRAVAANGKKLANGGESYKRRIDCTKAVENLFGRHRIVLTIEGVDQDRILRDETAPNV